MPKTTTRTTEYSKPSTALLWTEGGRAAAEAINFWTDLPLLAAAPRGDGQEVLVLPGLSADDSSTAVMRAVIASHGYSANAWTLGPNLGPTRKIVSGLLDKLDELYERQGRPVSLVGWSLGGILARVLTEYQPDKVRSVISLGSPFNLSVETSASTSHAGPLFEALRPWHTDFLDDFSSGKRKMTTATPATSVYSKLDGVVPWQACLDIEAPHRENIEVTASHLGMGMNPRVLSIVLDRLRQPERGWRPYQGDARSYARAA